MSDSSVKRVAIIGAGPAACATALTLCQNQENLSVCLFEAAEGAHFKIGESIPPAATPILRRLVGQQVDGWLTEQVATPGSISIWGDEAPGFNDFMFDLSGQGYHLNRAELEQQLHQIVTEKGVKMKFRHKFKTCHKTSQGFDLGFDVGGDTVTHNADFIVDASGINQVLVRSLSVARNTLDEVVFISALATVSDPSGSQSSSTSLLSQTLVETSPEGWWYAACLPQNRCMVSFCTDKQQLACTDLSDTHIWLAQLRKTKLLSRLLPHLDLRHINLFKRVAPSRILSRVVGEGWLAVGDSASSYDPVSSAGITKSLLYGEQAGQAIKASLVKGEQAALEEYQEAVFAGFNRYIVERNMLYQREKRFVHAPFWQRRWHPQV